MVCGCVRLADVFNNGDCVFVHGLIAFVMIAMECDDYALMWVMLCCEVL